MELKLFILGSIALVFYMVMNKYKGKILSNRKLGNILHTLFVIFIASVIVQIFMVYWQNRGTGQDVNTTFIFLATIIFIFFIVKRFLSLSNKSKDMRKKIFNLDFEWANTLAFSALFASIVMFFFIQAFKIPSASMRATLIERDHLFVNKAAYRIKIPFLNKTLLKFKSIKRGDIIVFKFPAIAKTSINCGGYQYGKDFVKRVIALPGDTVEVKKGRVKVNGEEIKEDYILYNFDKNHENINYGYHEKDMEKYQAMWERRILEHNEPYIDLVDNFGPVTMKQGDYFTLGDNRDHSCDSRFWGPVPYNNIKGKPWFIHWPISRVRIIK